MSKLALHACTSVEAHEKSIIKDSQKFHHVSGIRVQKFNARNLKVKKTETIDAAADFQPGQKNISVLYNPLKEINGVQIFVTKNANLSN